MTDGDTSREKQRKRLGGKKEADQIDEYNFFIAVNGNDTDEASGKESGNKETLKNGIVNSKPSIDFFLPE